MAKKNRRKKIVKYRRLPLFHFNIGTVLFGILFIYMVICLVLYLTTSRVTAYEVTAGSLSGNYRYTAIALKEETVVTAPQSGNVTYYAREGSKTGSGIAICSVQEGKSATASTQTAEEAEAEEKINTEAISRFYSTMSAYAANYNRINFQNVYNFEADLETGILEMGSESAAGKTVENISSSGLNNVCTAPQEGIVIYAQDGYEGKSVSDLTPDHFNQQDYEKKNLRLNESVKSGDPIYKLITDEKWKLVIQLDKKMFTKLSGEETVRFRFLKDGTSFNASYTPYQNGTNYYGVLEISNSVIRFSSDRFIDIELMMNQNTGLKIPNTAIAERIFYKIPQEYVSYDEDSPNEIRITKEIKTENGTSTKNVTATIFDQTETDYLVDSSLFEEGDTILMKDSLKRFTISETVSMQGVYNINKGYAIFREINIIDENEEYCIVKEGSAYGLSQYDHIALDASVVTDEQIIY